MKSRFISLAAIVAVAAIAGAAYQSAKIQWMPKAGTKMEYSMVANMTMEGLGDAKLSADVAVSIDKVEGDKITMTETQKNTKMTFSGQDMDQPEASSTVTAQPNGEVTKRVSSTESPVDLTRLEEATAFIYPNANVEVGGTWKRTRDGSQARTVASETIYKYEGDEEVNGVKCHKITSTFKETAGEAKATATGTTWLSIADSGPVKSVISAKNIALGDMGQMSFESTMIRK